MTKRENVLEKCRINLDKEKVLHSITRGEKEELQQRIDKAIEFIYENAYDEERKDCIDDLWGEIPKLLNILKGEDK